MWLMLSHGLQCDWRAAACTAAAQQHATAIPVVTAGNSARVWLQGQDTTAGVARGSSHSWVSAREDIVHTPGHCVDAPAHCGPLPGSAALQEYNEHVHVLLTTCTQEARSLLQNSLPPRVRNVKCSPY